jgi:HTH-type transcriptional regulator/antitoxin HipB
MVSVLVAGREMEEPDLPPFPKADSRGRFPALEYAQVSLARDLIRARKSAGLSQSQLADLAGLRQESISRLESGSCTARPGTVDKIMNAIEAERRGKKRKGR